MNTKPLVPVGDCGRSVDIALARRQAIAATRKPACVTRRPFYLAPDMWTDAPQPTGAEFPQTMRYEAPAEHERPTWRERLLRLVCYAVALWPALVAVALIWSASK